MLRKSPKNFGFIGKANSRASETVGNLAKGVLLAAALVGCDKSNLNSPPDTFDAGIQRPDIASDVTTDVEYDANDTDSNEIDAPAPEVNDTDTELEDIVDEDLDVVDEPVEIPVVASLLVRNVYGDLVEEPSSNFSSFELCAEDEAIKIGAITFNNIGQYYDLQVVSTIDDFRDEIALSSGDTRTVRLIFPDLILAEGDCTTLDFNLARAADENDSWLRYSISEVVASSERGLVAVRNADDFITVSDSYPVSGPLVVFNVSPGLGVTASNYLSSLSDVLQVPNNADFFTVSDFRFETAPNQTADVTRVSFQFAVNPDNSEFVARYSGSILDNVLGYQFDPALRFSIERGEDVIDLGSSRNFSLRDGDVVNVDFGDDSDLSYGNRMFSNFSGLFVPSGLENVVVSLVGVESSVSPVQVLLRDSSWNNYTSLPLNWHPIEFIEPTFTEPYLNLSFRSFDSVRNSNFVWIDDAGNVIRDSSRCYSREDCPLLNVNGYVDGLVGVPGRVSLDAFTIGILNDSDTPTEFLYTVSSGATDSPSYAERARGSLVVPPNSSFPLVFDSNFVLNSVNGYTFDIKIDIPDRNFNSTNMRSFAPDSYQFVVNNVNSSLDGEPLDTFFDGRMPYGTGDFGLYELPVTNAPIVMHAPAILNTGVRTPISNVDSRTYVPNTPITLLDSTWAAYYGDIEICSIQLQHDFNKETAPFRSFFVRIGDDDLSVLSDWTRTDASFTFEGACPVINSSNLPDGEFELGVVAKDPLFAEIQDNLRVRFNIVGINGESPLTSTYNLIVAKDFDDSGNPIPLNSDNPVRGGLVNFRP